MSSRHPLHLLHSALDSQAVDRLVAGFAAERHNLTTAPWWAVLPRWRPLMPNPRSARPSHHGINARWRAPGILSTLALIAASSIAVAPAGAAQPFDDPFSSFAVGRNPISVAVGDLNGDGSADLAVANFSSSTVSVLLGNGDGTFGTASDLATAANASAVAIGDLNKDGKLDIVAASYTSSKVSVLLGVGDGTFGPKTDYTVRSDPRGPTNNPVSVAIGDLNRDGNPDLVTANLGSSTVTILLGNGAGGFEGPTEFPTGSGANSVAIGDLNSDGKPDVAVANLNSTTLAVVLWGGDAPPDLGPESPTGGTVSVLLGNGDGTLGAKTDFATGAFASSVAIADLDADGNPDLAVANSGANSVSALLGGGDGAFGAATEFPAGSNPISIAVGDVDGDGKPDLVAANFSAHTVSVLLGHGDGTFGAATDFATGPYPASVAIGDLNGDHLSDLAVASYGSNTVSVLLNTNVPLAMNVSIDPQTFNLHALGHWVTAYLEPPAPFTPSQIDVSSIRLNGQVSVDPSAPTAIGDHDGNGIPDLMVKFDRGPVELTLSEGNAVPVTVTGTVDGHPFIGTATVRVMHGTVSAPAAGSTLQAGATIVVQWVTPSGMDVQSVALLCSMDDGATWTLVALDQPNAGSYGWTVPNVNTERARLAVVLVESSDATGYLVDGVLCTSSQFSIVGGTTGVDTDAKLEFALRGVAPNPARQALHVSFSLPHARPAKLGLYDVSGRRVVEREVGSLGPGVRSVTLDRPTTLPAGVYVIRLTRGGRSLTTRVAVTR